MDQFQTYLLTRTLPMTRHLLVVITLIYGIVTAGCMHHRLNQNEQYIEQFSNFYITQDKKQIAIVGKKYHYIFNAPPEIVNTLTSDTHPMVDAEFRYFTLQPNQEITGNYIIYIKEQNNKLTIAQQEKLKQLGFSFKDKWQLSGKISGTRYEPASDFSPDENSSKLNKVHNVWIEEIPSEGEKKRRRLLSPLAKVADGAVTIASIPLIPIIILVAAGSCGACR